MVAKFGLAVAGVSAIAYFTGPGPRNSFTTSTPIQSVWGGGDALASGVAGLALWFLFR